MLSAWPLAGSIRTAPAWHEIRHSRPLHHRMVSLYLRRVLLHRPSYSDILPTFYGAIGSYKSCRLRVPVKKEHMHHFWDFMAPFNVKLSYVLQLEVKVAILGVRNAANPKLSHGMRDSPSDERNPSDADHLLTYEFLSDQSMRLAIRAHYYDMSKVPEVFEEIIANIDNLGGSLRRRSSPS
ncbi:hypothetical protein Hte_012422 [Hypoxylon texense]